MKRVTKILLLLLVATLLCAGAGIYAFSATSSGSLSGKAPSASYAFKVFKPTAANGTSGSTTNYTASNLQTLKSTLGNSGRDGSVITLLSDITVTTDKDAAWNVTGTKYLDLNGYSITFVSTPDKTSALGYGFILNPNSTLYVYSSDTSYKSQIRTYVQGEEFKSNVMPIFNMRYDNSTLYFGTVDNAPQISAAGTGIYSRHTVSGDNIVTYSSALFSSIKSSYRENPTGAKAYIRGGTHYHTFVGHEHITGAGSSFITSYTGVDITIEDATLISTVSGALLSTKYSWELATGDGDTVNHKAPADGNITVNRCKFYSDGYIMEQAYESGRTENEYPGGVKLSSIVFNDCYFTGNVLKQDANNGTPDYNNCYFASAATTPGTTNKTVSADRFFTFKVPTVTYNYSNGTFSGISISSAKTVTAHFLTKTATEGNYATITWKAYGEELVTYWDNDGTVIPAPVFVEKSSNVYKYQYNTPLAPVTGDATYELVPTINFPFMTNLTLYAHFVYNVYIPKEIADMPEFISVSLAGKSCELKNVVEIQGEKYYFISHELPAKVADESFDLTMRIAGYEETFDYTKALSIPDYVNAVSGGSYSKEAKSLVHSAHTYIKAAKNYYTDSDLYDIPTLNKITGSAADAIPESLADVLYGVTLELGGTIKFRLFLYKDAPDFTLSYQVNNVRREFKLDKDDLTAIPDSNLMYYDVSVSAFDLRDSIRIMADDGTVYYYYLANYISSVQGESKHLTTLMDAIWEYSLRSEDYANVYNSQSPNVELTVGGEAIQSIVATTESERKAAKIIQAALKAMTDVTIPITNVEGNGASILVKVVAPIATYDARVYVNGASLTVECGYASFASSAATQFVDEYIRHLNSSYDFKADFSESYYTNEIYYSDFGAIGDGITNDFFAMKAAHDMANSTKRHTVYANSGKTYLIEDTRDASGKVHSITITTNVNWGDAHIIIKDTNFSSFDGTGVAGKNVFVIAPDTTPMTISDRETLSKLLANGFGTDTKVLDLNLGKSAMIVPYNTSHKVYRRIGYGKFEGQDMHELIIVNEDGVISSDTPFMFNYTSLDYILVYDISDTPITVEGGTITTLASHIDIVKRDENGNVIGANNGYIQRGIVVNRSNTTVKNVKHYVEGEITLEEQERGILGAPYHGFFSTSFAHNVTFDSCILTGRRCYSKSYVPGAGSGATGTYDYTVDNSNRVTFKNCVQSNFWIKVNSDGSISAAQEGEEGAQLSMTRIQYVAGSPVNFKRYWGLGGSNFSKNMTFLGSRLSRFDSHSGLLNGYIIDSDVNGISLTGGGELVIQNSRWFANADGGCDSFVDLRGDYGSTWNGTITIKDSTAYLVSDYNFSVIGLSYKNWYFGYNVRFPDLVLDNVTYLDLNGNPLVDANGKPLSKHVEVTGNTKAGDIFDYQGRIRLMSVDSSEKNPLDNEPNMHMPNTQNTSPIFAYVDENGDGYVDDIYEACGILLPYDKKNGFTPNAELYPNVQLAAGDTGLVVTTSRYNFNPVTPPESIIIKNDKYNYYIPLTGTTFFADTYISINGQTINGTAPEVPKLPEYTAPEAVGGLIYNGGAQELLVPGSAVGGTVMYKLAGGAYSAEVPTATEAGTYVIYYKVIGDAGYADVEEESIRVTIAKADPTVIAPTAINGLIYTAGEQVLVVPGVAKGCTILYKVGEDGEYSSALPTATDVGEYVIYYKIVGNNNYNDKEGGTIRVTISLAPLENFKPTESPVVSADKK